MEHDKRRGRRPGVAVDHEAIRRARQAAGLSLSDVAGTELSRASVHRVERGTARPSLPTLRIIAERLGASVDDFLLASSPDARRVTDEESLMLAHVERLVHDGSFSTVLVEVEQLLERKLGRSAEARLRLFAAIAHVQLLEPARSLVHLRRARSMFAELGEEALAIDCMGWEAAALNIQEDRSALEVAIAALRRCRELPGAPASTESRILGHLAGIYLSQHEWEPAIDAYKGAVAASETVRDLAGMTSLYEGMSIAHQGLGDLSMAAIYAQRAVALSSVIANNAALARLENNLGVLMLRGGSWSEAEQHLQRAIDYCESAGIVHGQSHVLLSLAQLAFMRHDHDRAEWYARRTIHLATQVGETKTCSLGNQWLGQIMAAVGRHEEGDAAFESALSVLSGLDAPRRLAECHQAYAEVLDQRGELTRAAAHWREAALLRNPPVDSGDYGEWIEPTHVAN